MGIVHAFLERLDPSLFQNITLGVLAIFIPFAIVFFNRVVNSGNGEERKFEKMVLSDEVLKIKRFFVVSISGIIFFAFLSGVETAVELKILAIIVAAFLVGVYWKTFKNILAFSEGHKEKFEASFLIRLKLIKEEKISQRERNKKIAEAFRAFWKEMLEYVKHIHKNFSSIFKQDDSYLIRYGAVIWAWRNFWHEVAKFQKAFLAQLQFPYKRAVLNGKKGRKMHRAWEAFWSEETQISEWRATDIYISHVDGACKHNNFHLAATLATTYANKIEKRDVALVREKILPKALEWEELFWRKEKIWGNNVGIGQLREMPYEGWGYIRQHFLKETIQFLCAKREVAYPHRFLGVFRMHIAQSAKKLDEMESEEEKNNYDQRIESLLAVFCQTLFDNADKCKLSPHKGIEGFPNDWEMVIGNQKNRETDIVLKQFIRWAEAKAFKPYGGDGNYEKLTIVTRTLFPNVEPSLFMAFLILFFSRQIFLEISGNAMLALQREPNFHIMFPVVMGSAISAEAKEEMWTEEFQKLAREDFNQHQNTAHIILNFFLGRWDPLTLVIGEDVSEEGYKNRDNHPRDEFASFAKGTMRKKLTRLKTEFEGDPAKNFCQADQRKEERRQDFVRLLDLLIKECK